ncbi:MAG TPA: zf-HC2 domain-containing protein [Ktedonobacteraceae bacterium]|jgi:Tol biopolymer transport system component|nr:zf-HC2 domain-containing protein [Ktedonobacteraceae bacterium]
MNCEQVEELLSAYLDNQLAMEERLEVTAHLRHCAHCSTIFADFRRNDALLRHLPRVSPDPALRQRIFSSQEYLELTGTFDARGSSPEEDWTVPNLPASHVRRNVTGRPHLVALPGGRSTIPSPAVRQSPGQAHLAARRSRRPGTWSLVAIAVAAILLIVTGIGGFLGYNLRFQQPSTTSNGAITPPAAFQQPGVPLSAGMRFVFLRNGTLWSALADSSSTQIDRLTPANVTVATGWTVSPPLPGRSAGDMLAYVDLQQARLHAIRSDGQQDTIIPLPLFKAGVSPASMWDTTTGMNILNSLAWSVDNSMLAFVADPTGSGQTNLYIYSTQTGTVQMVPFPVKGSAVHPVWSPDGVRLAFEVINAGTTSILDYNTQNHGLLTITGNAAARSNSSDSVLTLDWSPDINTPIITWSVGGIGHIHSLWERQVGAGESPQPALLLSGDFAQAIYSRNGHGGVGSWLVVTSTAGRAIGLWRIDITPGSGMILLTGGKQVSDPQWSPDGRYIDYLDALNAGVGVLHIINVATGFDSLIAQSVADNPTPAWSVDSQQLAYNTGTGIGIVNLQAGNQARYLKLRGSASAFTWSANSTHQLVVALSDEQPGIYLVDTQHNALQQLDKEGASGPIIWTEIP